MTEWGDKTGNRWQTFFDSVAPATALNMVTMGRISPWIIYSTEAAQRLLDRMEPGQIDTIAKHVDTKWWIKKIKQDMKQVQWMNTILTQALGT